ncbi:MAG: DUF3379 family protein [Woeseiaceae bacterium]
MNCDDYKTAIAADPSESFDGGARHSAECSSCSAYKAEMQALDAKIAAALAIDVPDLKMPDLTGEDKVVDLASRRRIRWTAPAWVGLAATVVLATVIGVRMIDIGTVEGTLAEQVIAHLDYEPRALRVTDEAVSDRKLYSVVRPAIATLDRDLGLITYAKSCKINGKEVPHLVVQGERGPVTILLMPHEMVDMPIPLDGERIEGVILPVGDGSIAIIGDRGEPIDQLKTRVTETVQWSV